MSDKKVYVHYEPLGGEAHTQSIPVEDTTTALDVIKAFVLTCKSINLELDLQCASARDENGSLLSPGVHVLSAVGNRSDIFITFTRDNPPAVTSAKGSSKTVHCYRGSN